ncbi:MAG: Lrp/AsnC family transcriptional regulator [Pseudomonadota bacterium]
MKLDRIDKAILTALQKNARISNVELANEVGLSPSACSRRLEQLERSHIIEGYQALISNRALGQTITAVVHVTLDRQSGTELETFENAIRSCPHIVACFLMSGEHDYILRVNAKDMEHFEYIHKNWLSALPGIARMQSSFAMRTVVNRANIDLASIDGT